MRKHHNQIKRDLIERTVTRGNRVLDVGSGQGGDLHKWNKMCVRLDMCDPDNESLQEAQKRALQLENNHMGLSVYEGDIMSTPNKKYDIICYNFSIHYIFESKKLFEMSIANIRKRLKPGGKLIGCVPNSDFIMMHTSFSDEYGNFIARKPADTGWGGFGEKLYVNLVDTPYYKNGPRPEPIAYKDLLITQLQHNDIHLVEWKPFESPYKMSQLYSTFIFVSK